MPGAQFIKIDHQCGGLPSYDRFKGRVVQIDLRWIGEHKVLFRGNAFDDAKNGHLTDVIAYSGHVEGSLTIMVDPISRINVYCWIVGPESIEKIFFHFAQLLGWNDLVAPFSLAGPSAFLEIFADRDAAGMEYATNCFKSHWMKEVSKFSCEIKGS
jgi:hypothetical protein